MFLSCSEEWWKTHNNKIRFVTYVFPDPLLCDSIVSSYFANHHSSYLCHFPRVWSRFSLSSFCGLCKTSYISQRISEIFDDKCLYRRLSASADCHFYSSGAYILMLISRPFFKLGAPVFVQIMSTYTNLNLLIIRLLRL